MNGVMKRLRKCSMLDTHDELTNVLSYNARCSALLRAVSTARRCTRRGSLHRPVWLRPI